MRKLAIAIALLASLVAGTSPARAEWRRAVSTHFVIYSEGSPDELRAAAERLERFDGLLRRLTATPPPDRPGRLTVYMPRSVAAIDLLYGGYGPVGFYTADIGGPFAVAPRLDVSQSVGADLVLYHEYMHHFMLQNYSTAYPPWLVEGYAELFTNVRFERDGSIVIGSFPDHRAGSLRAEPPPLRDLMFGGFRAVSAGLYYANAWALTHYLLISEERPGQLNRYVDLIAGGRPPEAAAEEAFGGIAALERDFRRYRRARRIPTLQVRFDQVPQPGPVAIETLSRAEESLVWLQVEYRQRANVTGRGYLAERVRRRAAETPGDPASLQLLADVEFLVENYPAATRAIDALIARQPAAPRALLRKGLIELAMLERDHIEDPARWVAARDWLRRANRADPDDPLVLFEYYRAFERQRVPPQANAVTGLGRALELIPQSFELRGHFGRELIRARRFREAVIVLTPVAYSAHGGRGSEAATRVIDAIRGLADGAEPPPQALVAPAPPESR